MKKLNNKGFSLVEILAAIAILAILMMVASQAFNFYKKRARQQAYDTMAKTATTAATNYLMENEKTKYIPLETLKDKEYVDTLQDPRYKEKECTGIVINKVIPGESQKQLDELFQKVKLCCKNYKYQYDYTGNDVVVTEINSCDYVEGDEIAGVYKLIYKPQGGTPCDPGVVIKNQREEWGPLCVTTKEKSVFKGWNTKKNGSGTTITEHTIVEDKDINVYAIWNPIYSLTYSEEGGTVCVPKTIEKENGEKWGTLCSTSKAGHAFKGWNTKKDGTGSTITKNTYAEKNLTVYAKWNPYYTITFDSNGGTACSPATITKEKGEKWGTLCSPTRIGYVFKGWNTKQDGTGTTVNANSIVSRNLKVYAIWNPKYTLTYDSNGGTACSPKTITVEKGEKWGTLCSPTRTGYSFDGWYNGTVKVTSSTRVDASITVKAKWVSKLYTLTYDNNNGTGCTTKNANYDSAWGTLCTPTRTGYKFTGWTKDGVTITKDTICKGNITVIANWTKVNYTLTFDTTNASCTTNKITKPYNEAWGTLCSPTKTGYTFGGWKNGSTTITSTSKATANITVTPIWNANSYKLTYDDNGGSGCSSKSVTKSYNTAWGTLCTPTRTGYSFVGWNTKQDGTGTTVNANSIVSGNIKVYAQWSVNAYTLKYNDNGGSGCSSKSVTKSYNTAWGTLCSPTKTGYTFAGWKNGSTTVTSTSKATADITVTAQWTINTYKLNYNDNGGSGCSSSTITKSYNTAWGTLCTPTRTGYSFSGWKNGSTTVTSTSKATSNITVTAQWTAKQYTLTYNSNGGSDCSSKNASYGSAWGSLCTPSKSGYTFNGWYDGSGNQVTSSTVCYGDKNVTANWLRSSVEKTTSGTKVGTSSSMTVTLSADNPDTSMSISGSATNGYISSCSYSGTNIVCNVTGITATTATSTEHCKKLASANNVPTGDIVYIGVSKSYNSADYYDNPADGIGCYIKVARGPKFKSSQRWSCYRAPNTFFEGSTDHCPKSYCGYSDCLTYGYENGYYCQCFRKVASNIKTYYETTVKVTYYSKG